MAKLCVKTALEKKAGEPLILDVRKLCSFTDYFVILSGRALIRKGDLDIATIGTGECFGEMACIAGQARMAAVLAKTDCILIKINATLIDRSSESIQLLFFKNFATTLVKRLSNKG